MSAAATIVHDPSGAVALCPALGLYLKPITKMAISVALPPLKQPGKSISNWEVMERLKAMVHAAAHAPFSALRIAKSTMDFIRFEGEVENRGLVRSFLACLDGKTIKLSGFADALRVRAAEFKLDFPTRHDWDSFFRDAEDMNETLPGERPDTIHLEGLPCRWFAPRGGGGGGGGSCGGGGSGSTGTNSGDGGSTASSSERPSEALLREVFCTFGEIRHVDIPMLDPYREEMTGRSFHTFSFGGHLNFEAYVQYREYAGFVRAMSALRGMKLMFKGDDGKAVACNIKVTFDATKHLSDASIRRRQLERKKLQELELQREEQKRREKEAEERQRAEERKQKEQEEQERARRREEKLRRREQRQRERESRRSRRRAEKLAAEEQRRLQARVLLEERRLLLAQRNLQSIRLVAELLSRAKTARLRQRQEERRRLQEAELRRVEQEKERALGLQRRERELRQRLLSLLLGRGDPAPANEPTPRPPGHTNPAVAADDLLRPVLDILHRVTRAGRSPRGARETPGASDTTDAHDHPKAPVAAAAAAAQGNVLACIPDNAQPKPGPTVPSPVAPPHTARDTERSGDDHDKCNREPEPVHDDNAEQDHGRQRQKRACGDGDGSPRGSQDAEAEAEAEREDHKEKEPRHQRDKDHGRERKRSRRHRGERERSRSRSRSPRHRGGVWNR